MGLLTRLSPWLILFQTPLLEHRRRQLWYQVLHHGKPWMSPSGRLRLLSPCYPTMSSQCQKELRFHRLLKRPGAPSVVIYAKTHWWLQNMIFVRCKVQDIRSRIPLRERPLVLALRLGHSFPALPCWRKSQFLQNCRLSQKLLLNLPQCPTSQIRIECVSSSKNKLYRDLFAVNSKRLETASDTWRWTKHINW